MNKSLEVRLLDQVVCAFVTQVAIAKNVPTEALVAHGHQAADESELEG